ncbi:MAG: fumarylacetoacetate hydrolase family protein [Deltaproteobacteria bacterium]|nr:fumarylacetoacetate hydrolase family protein [Deltaproteobacteria bacterium]
MRLANVQGRAALVIGDKVADVEQASKGRFGPDPMALLEHWESFTQWAAGVRSGDATAGLDESRLGPPVPRPAKVFGVGMNYRAHAAEAGLPIPSTPVIFTKFPNCIVGPRSDVEILSDYVDWEVELVAVVGRGGRGITEGAALKHVAGYCVGQDISDRKMQFADVPPQFSMGKSCDTYGPIGPALVSLDGFANPDDLAICCDLDQERVQDARTSDLIFSVAELVVFLSRYCTLAAGDMIFTGTPSGVGSTRNPRRYLKAGEEIVSTIEGIGTIRNRCVAAQR